MLIYVGFELIASLQQLCWWNLVVHLWFIVLSILLILLYLYPCIHGKLTHEFWKNGKKQVLLRLVVMTSEIGCIVWILIWICLQLKSMIKVLIIAGIFILKPFLEFWLFHIIFVRISLWNVASRNFTIETCFLQHFPYDKLSVISFNV